MHAEQRGRGRGGASPHPHESRTNTAHLGNRRNFLGSPDSLRHMFILLHVSEFARVSSLPTRRNMRRLASRGVWLTLLLMVCRVRVRVRVCPCREVRAAGAGAGAGAARPPRPCTRAEVPCTARATAEAPFHPPLSWRANTVVGRDARTLSHPPPPLPLALHTGAVAVGSGLSRALPGCRWSRAAQPE